MKVGTAVASPFSTLDVALDELVRAAVLAPSGDNTQPWRFEIDVHAPSITVAVDEMRDRSPMNAGQRMSRIAVGAAVENVVRTADHSGLGTEVQVVSKDAVRVRIHGFDGRPIRCPEEIRQRCTNRRPYDGRPLPETVLEELRGIETPPEITLRWLADREEIERAAEIVRRADALMFGNAAMRNAFLANVRFDRPANEPVNEGLSLGSLEASSGEARALSLLRKLPNWAATALRVGPSIARKTKQLIRSASAIAVGLRKDEDEQGSDFIVGMHMERAWLRCTESGLSVQPIMSIPVLYNRSQLDNRDHGKQMNAKALCAKLTALCTNSPGYNPVFAIRVGRATTPTARVGRRTRQLERSDSPQT